VAGQDHRASRATTAAKRRLGLLEGDTTLTDVARDSKEDAMPSRRSFSRGARRQCLSDGVVDDGFKERIALRLERVEAAMSRRIARGTGVLATIGAIGALRRIIRHGVGYHEFLHRHLRGPHPPISPWSPPELPEALLATALGLNRGNPGS